MSGPRTGLRVPIISDLGDAAIDVITSVFDRVPGSDWIGEAVSGGATWLGDMAQTAVGRTILTAISMTYLYGPLAGLQLPGAAGQVVVGPIVASATWALPGMVAGENFTESYVTELTWRIQGLIEYFAGRSVSKIGENAARELGVRAGELFGEQLQEIAKNPIFQQYMHEFKTRIGVATTAEIKRKLQEAGLSPEALAARLQDYSKRFNVPADVFAAAINANFKDFIYDINTEFDIQGRPIERDRYGRPLSPHTRVTDVLLEQASDDPIRKKRASQEVALQTEAATPSAPRAPSENPFGELLLGSLLTAPLWVPVFLLPAIRKRKSKQ